MNIGDFKTLVADFMNRGTALFDEGVTGRDKLLIAANQAKAYAQRKLKFEAARTYATLTVADATGGALSDAKLLSDGSTPCLIRNLECAFLPNVVSAWYPIDVIGMQPYMDEMKKFGYPGHETDTRFKVSKAPRLIKDGNQVWVMPWPDASTSHEVKLRVVRFLPDYTTDNDDTDFFLNECQDWMLYRTVQQLNFFLKEDQRVVLSEAVVKDAWETVKAWNAEYAQGPTDLDLD